MKKLARVQTPPVDLLDAARTVRLGRISSCDWLPEWAPAPRFLDWARRGLSESDEYGLSNAISYAKKSVACRIDGILRTYHLRALSRAKYPLKIRALNELGVSVPQIVSELVIDPRNELEHQYSMPAHQAARRAIEIAELFLSATEAESNRFSIVAVNWNILGGQSSLDGRYSVRLDGFGDEPMLFIDVFDDPSSVRIVNPSRDEIRWAPLASFDSNQTLQLATLLRTNYSVTNGLFESRSSPIFFREMKRLGEF